MFFFVVFLRNESAGFGTAGLHIFFLLNFCLCVDNDIFHSNVPLWCCPWKLRAIVTFVAVSVVRSNRVVGSFRCLHIHKWTPQTYEGRRAAPYRRLSQILVLLDFLQTFFRVDMSCFTYVHSHQSVQSRKKNNLVSFWQFLAFVKNEGMSNGTA